VVGRDVTVECVIFDVSGTLVDASGAAQPGVAAAIRRLRRAQVMVVAAGNHPYARVAGSLRSAGLTVDLIASRDRVGKPKGSPCWIDYICQETGFEPHELFYVGDTHYDMVTAVQASVIYAHAKWAAPAGQYGLVAPAPGWVPVVVEHIFRKSQLWYWSLDATDDLFRPVWVRTLIDANGAGEYELYKGLFRLLKDGRHPTVGQLLLRDFVMMHMLASLYASNMLARVDYWTTWPGHDGSINAPMGGPLTTIAKLFKQKYFPDLFIRHEEAERSSEAYDGGGLPKAWDNQLETVVVNQKFRNQLADKSVLVIDNYVTRGPSTEAARNLLLAAGSKDVLVAGVSKYELRTASHEYAVFTPTAGTYGWDPFKKNSPSSRQFRTQLYAGAKQPAALTAFAESYRSVRAELW